MKKAVKDCIRNIGGGGRINKITAIVLCILLIFSFCIFQPNSLEGYAAGTDTLIPNTPGDRIVRDTVTSETFVSEKSQPYKITISAGNGGRGGSAYDGIEGSEANKAGVLTALIALEEGETITLGYDEGQDGGRFGVAADNGYGGSGGKSGTDGNGAAGGTPTNPVTSYRAGGGGSGANIFVCDQFGTKIMEVQGTFGGQGAGEGGLGGVSAALQKETAAGYYAGEEVYNTGYLSESSNQWEFIIEPVSTTDLPIEAGYKLTRDIVTTETFISPQDQIYKVVMSAGNGGQGGSNYAGSAAGVPAKAGTLSAEIFLSKGETITLGYVKGNNGARYNVAEGNGEPGLGGDYGTNGNGQPGNPPTDPVTTFRAGGGGAGANILLAKQDMRLMEVLATAGTAGAGTGGAGGATTALKSQTASGYYVDAGLFNASYAGTSSEQWSFSIEPLQMTNIPTKQGSSLTRATVGMESFVAPTTQYYKITISGGNGGQGGSNYAGTAAAAPAKAGTLVAEILLHKGESITLNYVNGNNGSRYNVAEGNGEAGIGGRIGTNGNGKNGSPPTDPVTTFRAGGGGSGANLLIYQGTTRIMEVQGTAGTQGAGTGGAGGAAVALKSQTAAGYYSNTSKLRNVVYTATDSAQWKFTIQPVSATILPSDKGTSLVRSSIVAETFKTNATQFYRITMSGNNGTAGAKSGILSAEILLNEDETITLSSKTGSTGSGEGIFLTSGTARLMEVRGGNNGAALVSETGTGYYLNSDWFASSNWQPESSSGWSFRIEPVYMSDLPKNFGEVLEVDVVKAETFMSPKSQLYRITASAGNGGQGGSSYSGVPGENGAKAGTLISEVFVEEGRSITVGFVKGAAGGRLSSTAGNGLGGAAADIGTNGNGAIGEAATNSTSARAGGGGGSGANIVVHKEGIRIIEVQGGTGGIGCVNSGALSGGTGGKPAALSTETSAGYYADQVYNPEYYPSTSSQWSFKVEPISCTYLSENVGGKISRNIVTTETFYSPKTQTYKITISGGNGGQGGPTFANVLAGVPGKAGTLTAEVLLKEGQAITLGFVKGNNGSKYATAPENGYAGLGGRAGTDGNGVPGGRPANATTTFRAGGGGSGANILLAIGDTRFMEVQGTAGTQGAGTGGAGGAAVALKTQTAAGYYSNSAFLYNVKYTAASSAQWKFEIESSPVTALQEFAGTTINEVVVGKQFNYLVTKSGYYQFELCGGTKYDTGLGSFGTGNYECISGRVSGIILLEKGEIVSIKDHPGAGGSNNAVLSGKSGIGLYVDGKLIAGAGGASGFSYYKNSSGTPYSLNGSKNAKTDINGSGIFGGGGSSDYAADGRTPITTAGAPSKDGVPANDSGKNVIDTSRVTDWTSDLAPRPTLGTYTDAKYTLINIGTSTKDIEEKVEQVITSLSAIGAPADIIPIVYVIENEQFNIRLNVYDDMDSGAASGVTVVNSVKGDGFIRVSGKLSGAGERDITINNRVFTFIIIEQPKATNVVVKL